MRWTVDSVNNGFVTVKNDTGERIVLTPDYCRRYLELDYAMTIDSAQGITVDKAICILREGMGRSYLYSAATRGRSGPDYLVVGSSNPAKTLAEIVSTDDLALTAREIASQIMLENKANKKMELNITKNLQVAESMGYNNPLPDSSHEHSVYGM
jgi:ATP-dependent exoDNAse (exonuclease V), alpha subunit - helicase superfamily I member